MKPYAKLASTLIALGAGILAVERFGLSEFRNAAGQSGHIDENLLSVLLIAPLVLIAAGCVVFMVGRMRRR